MKVFKNITTSLITGLMLVSCVTINIYFPAAAAEKAADRIIEDIWGTENQPGEPDASKMDQQSSAAMIGLAVLDWVISPAAAEPDLNINSAAINAIQTKMKTRHASLKPFLDSGAIGLTSEGLLASHDKKAIALKDRNRINGLIADENQDRDALYGEIARANGHPEWKAGIQATFARRWISNAASGWWYLSSGDWQQKN